MPKTDPSSLEPLSVDDRTLCERYSKLYGGAVNDVLREMGYLHQALPPRIAPLRESMKVAGIAFTVKGSKDLTTEGEMEQRAAMLEALHSESIVVWDTSEDDESAQWGEVMTKAARRAGCRGAVVDGGVRDTQLVLDQDFPVFCCYRSSNGMLGRFRMHSYQTPIQIGATQIHPGDVIFGDIDGVVAVPRRHAVEVLERAEQIAVEEQKYKQWIDDGLSPSQIVEQGGYF